MIVEHRFEMIGRCPVDDTFDHYRVTVRTNRTVPVEEIVTVADRIGRVPAMQEDITADLAGRFGVHVTTVGTHMSGRVSTTCTAGRANCPTDADAPELGR